MSKEAMKLALKKAFQLGQDYWYQADHDSYRENKKSDETLAKFRQLVDETCEALAKPDFWAGYVPEPDGTCSNALRAQGKAYPRTCKKCGLGPCVELAQQALNKKAENARELGLDYEPVQQEPLTDEQIDRLWSQSLADTEGETYLPLREFARAIEAKLKEKNT